MIEKFKPLFIVKSSLISLYLALTIPIPFVSSEDLKFLSIFTFIIGLFLIVNITNDCVKTCDEKISYQPSFISKIFGKRKWEIYWKEIKLIKSLPTSQGSKVHYFITNNNESFLIPQRIEDIGKFLLIVESKTKLDVDQISYISPLWTYKVLTYLSIFMIIGEIVAFTI